MLPFVGQSIGPRDYKGKKHKKLWILQTFPNSRCKNLRENSSDLMRCQRHPDVTSNHMSFNYFDLCLFFAVDLFSHAHSTD